MVPTWTLLAALAAGVILGPRARGCSFHSAAVTPPTQDLPPAVSNEPTLPPPLEPVRISMEDVVSELERRYQGRQADAAAEKPRSTTRRRRRPR